MTDKKTGRSDRRGKTPWYVEEGKRRAVTGREKTLRCDRKELIRRSLDDCRRNRVMIASQSRGNFFRDVFLRKRGMTGIRKEGEMAEQGRDGCNRRMS